jgi:hypothetical protein
MIGVGVALPGSAFWKGLMVGVWRRSRWPPRHGWQPSSSASGTVRDGSGGQR